MSKAFELILNVILKIGMTLYTVTALAISIFTTVSEIVLQATVELLNTLSEFGGDSFNFQIDEGYQWLALANAWVPIQETWALFVFAVPFMLVIVVFRFVKQFIPTLSN